MHLLRLIKKMNLYLQRLKEKRNIKSQLPLLKKIEKSISNSDATYNGYGSLSEIRREKKSKPTSKVSSKNIKYKRSAPVTFSAYSTN